MACSCPRGAGRRHGLLRGGLLAAGMLVATFCAGAPARAQMNEGTADPTAPSLWLVHAIQETKDFDGFICPAEVRLDGSIYGDAGMTGMAIFTSKQEGPVVEAQSQVQEQQFSLDTYGTFDIVKSFQMQWRNVSAAGDIPPRQKVTLQFIVARHHTAIAQTQRTIELACRKPTPPELTLSFRITKEEIIEGFVCPTEILTDGHISTKEALSGQVQHQVWFGPETPSASATKDINMGAGDALSYGFFAPIDWRGYVFSQDLTPQRSLSLHFRVYREGVLFFGGNSEVSLRVLPKRPGRWRTVERRHGDARNAAGRRRHRAPGQAAGAGLRHPGAAGPGAPGRDPAVGRRGQ
jgi:hypothetical protein